MAVRLGDTAPDFTADTTQGDDQLPRVARRLVGRAVLPSQGLHAGLHDRARLRRQDQARVRQAQRQGHRPLGRPASTRHEKWEADIEETQGTAVNFPMIGDPDRKVADLYDMIHPNANDTLTVRSVFVIGPDKKVKLTITYPASTGRNFDEILRVIDSLQLTANHKVATPANWKDGDDVIIVPARHRRRGQGAVPQRLGRPEALPARHQAAQQVAAASGRRLPHSPSGVEALQDLCRSRAAAAAAAPAGASSGSSSRISSSCCTSTSPSDVIVISPSSLGDRDRSVALAEVEHRHAVGPGQGDVVTEHVEPAERREAAGHGTEIEVEQRPTEALLNLLEVEILQIAQLTQLAELTQVTELGRQAEITEIDHDRLFVADPDHDLAVEPAVLVGRLGRRARSVGARHGRRRRRPGPRHWPAAGRNRRPRRTGRRPRHRPPTNPTEAAATAAVRRGNVACRRRGG